MGKNDLIFSLSNHINMSISDRSIVKLLVRSCEKHFAALRITRVIFKFEYYTPEKAIWIQESKLEIFLGTYNTGDWNLSGRNTFLSFFGDTQVRRKTTVLRYIKISFLIPHNSLISTLTMHVDSTSRSLRTIGPIPKGPMWTNLKGCCFEWISSI